MARATFEEIEMATATFGDFGKDWTIRDWGVAGRGPIPGNAFVVASRLAIRELTSGIYVATWTAGDGQERSIRLTRQENGTLSDLVELSFRGQTFWARATLSMDGLDRLNGTIAWNRVIGREGGLDGNTGTFAADTNPPLPDPV